MQPYFFPYLGYFQLMHAVDTFVFYDDVNYINRGYINRNAVLGHSGEQRITLELVGASQNKLINQIDVGTNKAKLVKTIRSLYSKAPEAARIMPLVEDCLASSETNLARFLGVSLTAVAEELGLTPTFLYSSEIEKDPTLKGQDKILALCQALGARTYINPQGGRDLYDTDSFSDAGIDLLFHRFTPMTYDISDPKRAFIPFLSVIDFMMWVPRDARAPHMHTYELAP